jgi:outer membrane protein assembly factor BamE (lipoprotein component of BamABCDE complex)
VYVGTPLDEEAVRLVRPGMTKAEVLELLGPPDTPGLRLDGTVFIYRYQDEGERGLRLSLMQASVKYESTDRLTHRVVVFFDKKGIVTGVGRDHPGQGPGPTGSSR